jgi:hypothetical protein
MKRSHPGLFGIMVLVCGMIVSPISINAQTYQQTVSTDAGTLRVGVSTDPASPKSGEQSKLKIDFLNPQTNQIQEHIDYTVLVTNNGNSVFGPIPLTHTSLGTATIPIEFRDGENKVVIDIQGILFRPIPSEKAAFSIIIGDKPAVTQPKEEPKVIEKPKSEVPPIKDKNAVGSATLDKKDDSKETKKLGKPKYDDIKKSTDSKDKKKDVKQDSKKDTKKKSDKKQIKKPVKSTKSD